MSQGVDRPSFARPAGGLGRGVVLNVVGRGCSAALALVFVPVYLKALGVESYGLIGFSATLQAAFAVFDLGLTTTLNRELSRRLGIGQSFSARDLVRTLELLYWLIAAAVALALILSSQLLASRWLNPGALSADTVRRSLTLIALMLAFQWPFGFYCGGLLGLERNATYNTLLIVSSAARYAGAAWVVSHVSPTIEALLAWQVCCSALSVMAAAWLLWRALPRDSTRKARWSRVVLASTWQFTLSMMAVSMTIFLLSQLDRLLVSKLVSLESFGYYSVAATVAAGLYSLATPVGTAVFPKLSRAIAHQDPSLAATYHSATQCLVALSVPVATVLAVFAEPILQMWTHSSAVASRASVVLAVMSVATALNGVLTLPYLLQVAYGTTALTFKANCIGLFAYSTMLALSVPVYGIVAAPICWLILNVGYLALYVPLMHRTLLPGELMKWYWNDLAVPTAAAVGIVAAIRVLTPGIVFGREAFVIVAVSLVASWAGALAAVPAGRRGFARVSAWRSIVG